MTHNTESVPYFYFDAPHQDIAKRLAIIGDILDLVTENKPFYLDNKALHLIIRASLWLLEHQFQLKLHKGLIAGIILLTYQNLSPSTQQKVLSLLIETFNPSSDTSEKEKISDIMNAIVTTLKAACYYCILPPSDTTTVKTTPKNSKKTKDTKRVH